MELLGVRFWSKVNKTDTCWLWIAADDGYGYGVINNKGKVDKAHRLSYMQAKGIIPEGLCVCHKCDNPPCVNPDHLFLGTRADNMIDKKNKGRDKKGSQLPHSKLTERQVLEIRKLKSQGFKNKEIALKYDILPNHVSRVNNGTRWKHVT